MEKLGRKFDYLVENNMNHYVENINSSLKFNRPPKWLNLNNVVIMPTGTEDRVF